MMDRVGGWLSEMLYSLEVLKKESWRWTGVFTSCGGGGGGGGGGFRGTAGVMNTACLDPRGPAAACLRCRYFRRKQRLLAFLTASTGISFILLLLHTPSIILPQRGLLTADKELPDRSHYVKKDVHLLGEARKVSVASGPVLIPAVYRNRYYPRQNKPAVGQTTVRIVSNDHHDLFKHYRSGSDIVDSEYFRIPPRQKQKSFERKLNLLELRSYRGSPDGGGRWARERGEGDEDEEEKERERDINNNDVLKVPPHYFENIDPVRNVKHIEASRNESRKPSPSPSTSPPRSAPTRGEGDRGGAGGGAERDEDDHDDNDEDEETLTSMIVVYDYKRPAYFPWRTTRDECANYATRFMVGGGAPLVASISFPGAGNTWLRYITEGLTGVFTGSVYHDEVLAIRGFWGERDGYRQGTTLIQKTHSFPLLAEEMKDGIYNGKEFRFLLPSAPRKVIVLLRNPWESLLALRHYHAAGHTGFANTAFFKGPEWANFTSERAKLWVQLYTSWLSLPDTNIFVVHYEHLQHRIEREAKRLVEFLGLPLDYGRLECLIKYPEGRFRRPKYPKHLQGYNFPSASANILREGMGSVDSILRQGGHPSLPTHLYSFTPPIQDSSAPLDRL